MKKWEIDLDTTLITGEESQIINSLLEQLGTSNPQVEDIWRLMDEVWDEIGINNLRPDPQLMEQFYSHPVWLMNSLFVEQDALSMSQRGAIKDWIEARANEILRVVDFGGGLGTLGILISDIGSQISIDIYEPFSSHFAENRIAQKSKVRFIKEPVGLYDCLLSIDVLEHVTDPIKIMCEMIDTIRQGGYLVVANNFKPVIKCHLPGTFHLRFTFRFLARLMGLRREGPCIGSHATVYRKTGKKVGWIWIRIVERMSKVLYYPLHIPYFFYRKLYPQQVD